MLYLPREFLLRYTQGLVRYQTRRVIFKMKLLRGAQKKRRFTVIVPFEISKQLFKMQCFWSTYHAFSSFQGIKIFSWSMWTPTLTLIFQICIQMVLFGTSLPAREQLWACMFLHCVQHAVVTDEVEVQNSVYQALLSVAFWIFNQFLLVKQLPCSYKYAHVILSVSEAMHVCLMVVWYLVLSKGVSFTWEWHSRK